MTAAPRWAVPAWRVAAVQAMLVLGWAVYAVWLPALLTRQGLPVAWVPWLLLADQAIFVGADAAAGRLADRLSRRALRRVLVVAVAGSALAFTALPLADGPAAGPLWWALLGVWLLASSALRAPVLALLAPRARAGAGDAGLGLVVCGMALASALAPLVGRAWAGVDPLWPFAVAAASLALAVATVLGAADGGTADGDHASDEAATAVPPGALQATARPGLPALAAAMACGTLAAQWWTIVAPPRLDPAGSVFWGPTFWVGAALMLPLASRWAGAPPRRGRPPVLPVALGAAAAMALVDAMWPAAGTPARALGGAAWALAMTALLRQGLGGGPGGGTAAGVLSGAQALAAVARLALGVSGAAAGLMLDDVALVPAAAFTLAAALVLPRPPRGTVGGTAPPGEPRVAP